jgi:NADPH2:quinone reductase
VHAAAGGVGLLLVQMAKEVGARVFGTTSTEEKAALVRQAGADEVVLYALAPFDEVVRSRTGGRAEGCRRSTCKCSTRAALSS